MRSGTKAAGGCLSLEKGRVRVRGGMCAGRTAQGCVQALKHNRRQVRPAGQQQFYCCWIRSKGQRAGNQDKEEHCKGMSF